jgi:GntR family transcriptional repressor for pyruvate dehydrogenase complex
MPDLNFGSARRRKATDIIIEAIRVAVLDGTLAPGDRLPPEKELGEQFGVSKQTLRESLRALEHMGLITMRKGAGGGAFIAAVEQRVVVRALTNYLYFQQLTLDHLAEIRRVLEPLAARKAARGIGADDLARLKRINDDTAGALKNRDWQRATECEVQFHLVIASHCDNPILLVVMSFVEELLADFKRMLAPDEAFMGDVARAHEAIYDALAAGDEDAAAAEMERHVIEVEQALARLSDGAPGAALNFSPSQAA